MATPTLVQHVKWVGNGNSETANNITYKLANATLAGNCLELWMQFPSNVTTVTITDNATAGTNSWPALASAITVTDAGNSMKCALFILPNAYAGATVITVVLNAAKNAVKAAFQEWYNVATSSPTDGSASQLATTTSVSSGSFNTTVDGDLIQQWVGCTDAGTSGLDGSLDGFSQVVKATGYTLSQVDLTDGFFSEYEIQTTHGATNPAATITVSAGSFTFPSITVALQAASSGTAPSGSSTYIFGMLHSRIIGSGGAGNLNYNWQFPTVGNTFVGTASDPVNSIQIVGVSGTSSGTWTVPAASGFDPSMTYKASGTASTDEMLTVTLNDAIGHVYCQGIFYDIMNGGAFDQVVQTVGGTTFGPGNSTPAVSLSPGVSAGVVIGVIGINTGPPDSIVTPTGAVFLSCNYTGMSDLSYMDNGDFHGCYLYSSNAAQSWVFHNTASTTGFGAALISFAGTVTGPPYITVQPQNTSVYVGQTATFTVTASGTDGTISYQWQQFITGSWTNVGTNSTSYTTGALGFSDNGDMFRVVVTDSNGTTNSNVAETIVIGTANLMWLHS